MKHNFHNEIHPTTFNIIFGIHLNISEEICNPSYVFSQRGHCQLTHNGFRYRKDKDSKKGTRWRCSTRPGGHSCKGKAFTYNKNGLEYAKFSCSQSHDHPPHC